MHHFEYQPNVWEFWNEICDKHTDLLWVPNESNKSVPLKTNSWFDLTSVPNPNPSPDLIPELSKCKVIKQSNMVCNQWRIQPTDLQRQKLMTWFGYTRHIYNAAVNVVNEFVAAEDESLRISSLTLSPLRELVKIQLSREPWYQNMKVPFEVKDGPIRQMVSSLKSCRSNGNLEPFFKHITKKETQTIVVRKGYANRTAIYGSTLGSSMKYRKTRGWNLGDNDFSHECKVMCKRTSNGYQFYLVTYERLPAIQHPVPHATMALDPGVRTFMTGFSQKEVLHVCQDHKKINRLQRSIDRYNSRGQQWRANKLNEKITNMVKDMHWKTANYLCRNYATVIIPKFDTKEIAKITSTTKTNRDLYMLSHYKFRLRLIEKARQYGTTVIVGKENYTSKTCTVCGTIKDDLGSSKIYTCTTCDIVLDRDVNGARNIYLRNLVLNEKDKRLT